MSPQTMTTITASSSSSSSNSSTTSSSLNSKCLDKNSHPRPINNNGPLFDTCLNEAPIPTNSINNNNNNINSNDQQYRNEIYRNSHLILSKQNLYQYTAVNKVQYQNINIYEAKPIQINNNQNETTSPFSKENSSTNTNQITIGQQISCV